MASMKALAKLPPRLKEEIVGILILTLGVLTFFSLFSHTAEDDLSFIRKFDFSIFEFYPDNWIGLIGALLSYLLFYLLGLLAYFLPLFAAIIAVKYLFRWQLPRLRSKTYYTFFLCLSLCLILSLHYIHTVEAVDFTTTPGGALSVGLASFFAKLFGRFGAPVVFLMAILVLLFLITEWRPAWWDKSVVTFPSRVRQRLLAFFGVGVAAEDAEIDEADQSRVSKFTPRALFYPIRRWLGRGGRTSSGQAESNESAGSRRDVDRDDRLMEIAERLGDRDKVEQITEMASESSSGKDRMVLKLTRKPEDGFQFPTIDLLSDNPASDQAVSGAELNQVAAQLLETLKTFNIEVVDGKVEKFPGPVITRYEFKPAPGIKVNQVLNLADDLALALQAKRIRIIAPVPGKAAIGVEIPNRYPQTVYLKDVVADKRFDSGKSTLPMALGLTTSGQPYIADLSVMPHLLIAGATGSGKSVCMNVIITSLIFRHHPKTLRFIFIDPKMLELSVYSGIPYLERPVITQPNQAEKVLNDAVIEMENRYKRLAAKGVRNIEQFNAKLQASERLPYIIIMVDELADLMMSTQASRIEILFTRLAQMARAVGIHLILATQRPSVDVITGLIKANFSARIAFQVASKVDSRTILDANGAEKLLGSGDMLFLAPGQAEPIRIHGAYISSEETGRLVGFLKEQAVDVEPIEMMTEEASKNRVLVSESDPLVNEAAEVVIRHKQGSVSLLQRRLGIGYQRAARLIDLLEEKGVVGAYDGSKAREVLVDLAYLDKLKSNPEAS